MHSTIQNPVLIVFSGLPGSGKSTIGKALITLQPFVYLRIDAIEHSLKTAYGKEHELGPAGYVVAYALAKSNLALGTSVVADCVNPLAATREAWRAVAASTSSRLLEIEVVCSNAAEHRSRVEGRVADIEGFALPTWQAVMHQHYEPWTTNHLVIDTSALSAREAAEMVLQKSRRLREEG